MQYEKNPFQDLARQPKTGKNSICPQELEDLKRSISYHFWGGYVHKANDRIFDKETTIYLRKKYNL